MERSISGGADDDHLWPEADVPVVVVDLDDGSLGEAPTIGPDLIAVVVGVGENNGDGDPAAHPGAPSCDVVVPPDHDAIAAIIETVRANPIASLALVTLLRAVDPSDLNGGLFAESATYSVLQSGSEFQRWAERYEAEKRATRHGGIERPDSSDQSVEQPEGGASGSDMGDDHDTVVLERDGSTLTVELNQPEVHNALDADMRRRLVEAFTVARLDPTVHEIRLSGRGRSFCAGGHLGEFGTFVDPAVAHLVRLRTSVARALDAVSDRVTVRLHGACFGAGIEIASFAGTVEVEPGCRIALPEVSLGLIPGAGGTVGITRRIGRWRTARLALTGETLDAHTALDWGLADILVAD